MTPSELVGRRITEARQERGMSQAQLGQALAPYLGKPWAKQTVSLVEEGRRELSVPELVALALLFVRPLHWFIRSLPENGEETVNFPGGQRIPAASLSSVLMLMEHLPPLETAEAASAFVLETADREAELVRLAEQIRDTAASNERVLRHLAQAELRVSSRLTAEGTVTRAKRRPQRRSRKGGSDAT